MNVPVLDCVQKILLTKKLVILLIVNPSSLSRYCVTLKNTVLKPFNVPTLLALATIVLLISNNSPAVALISNICVFVPAGKEPESVKLRNPPPLVPSNRLPLETLIKISSDESTPST